MRVGVVGLGSVGNAIFEVMSQYHAMVGYDVDGRGAIKEVLDTEAALVCVPTNGTDTGELDMSAVDAVCNDFSRSRYQGIIVIKSTLHPGTMERLEYNYTNLKLVYMPEFLREKDAEEWFQYPDRLVVSGVSQYVSSALELFSWVPENIPRLRMSHIEAEIAKLAHNAYIATKVTFTCEIERICESKDADPLKVMEVIWNDRRVMNPAHLTPGLGGFGGKCVPKDTRSLRQIDTNENDDSLLAFVLANGTKERIDSRRERIG